MRRLIALALLAGVVLALPTMASGLGQGDVRGPACTDVIGGSGTTAAVVGQLAAAPCSAFSYTLDVYTDASMTTKLASLTNYDLLPDNQIGFNQIPGDSDNSVCVVLTTSAGNGKHVFDRAPDASLIPCVEVLTSGSPGFQDFS